MAAAWSPLMPSSRFICLEVDFSSCLLVSWRKEPEAIRYARAESLVGFLCILGGTTPLLGAPDLETHRASRAVRMGSPDSPTAHLGIRGQGHSELFTY